MNDQDFNYLLRQAQFGRTVEVLAAVDLDVGLVNRVGQLGWTLLIEASFGGHVDLIQGLLERKADIHARDATGWDSVMQAADRGHLPALTLLMNSGASMTTTANANGMNALMFAAMFDSLSCAVFLLSRGCDLRLVDNEGQSALDLYGTAYNNNLSNEIKEQRRQILRDAFAEGPHISQVCSRLAVANQVNHSIAPTTSLTTTIPTLPLHLLSSRLRSAGPSQKLVAQTAFLALRGRLWFPAAGCTLGSGAGREPSSTPRCGHPRRAQRDARAAARPVASGCVW